MGEESVASETIAFGLEICHSHGTLGDEHGSGAWGCFPMYN